LAVVKIQNIHLATSGSRLVWSAAGLGGMAGKLAKSAKKVKFSQMDDPSTVSVIAYSTVTYDGLRAKFHCSHTIGDGISQIYGFAAENDHFAEFRRKNYCVGNLQMSKKLQFPASSTF